MSKNEEDLRIKRCAACLAEGESYPMPATLDELCDFHRQIIEAKCEGPSWGKDFGTI